MKTLTLVLATLISFSAVPALAGKIPQLKQMPECQDAADLSVIAALDKETERLIVDIGRPTDRKCTQMSQVCSFGGDITPGEFQQLKSMHRQYAQAAGQLIRNLGEAATQMDALEFKSCADKLRATADEEQRYIGVYGNNVAGVAAACNIGQGSDDGDGR